ncbi:hypothetical protein FRC11_006449 [Ceratobasidium sp. 423]|nr:hypothetical protein FRC11_006449 [Ceratobasidium sp. 423]
MKFSCSTAYLISLCFAGIASAANSFAGANLYYAAGLNPSQHATLLSNMQSAGMKVLRVWLDGQFTATTKGTAITETTSVGTYDPTMLNLLDDFMMDAHKYGIKFIISMHSWNALSGGDIYDQWWGIGCAYTHYSP